MADLIGRSLGRYHVLEQLGEGGMAVVYKARDTRLDIHVAVKIIRMENVTLGALERTLKRFEREAKALARLTHPNIVKVTDYGEYEGKPYLVMPLLSGGTLKSKLSGKPMPWQEAVQILIAIADALGYAHKHDIIHRDVKPANILITENGQPMLADFGVAKILDVEETMELTGTGVGIGTPEYMAPEQVTNKLVDARIDIYALGVVLFEMVTGRKPFIADTPMATLIMHSRDPLPRPRSFAPNLPQSVENILLKALAKEPQNRFDNMEEFSKAMEGALDGKKFNAPKTNAGRKRAEFELPSILRRAALTVGLIALGLGLLAVFFKPFPSFPAQLSATSAPSDAPTFTPTRIPTDIPTLTPTRTPGPTLTVTATPDMKILNPANQHLYFYVKQRKTWHEARDYCTLLGGHLVTILNDAENAFIYNLAVGGGWLGATDEVKEFVWQWVTGESWKFTKWGTHIPKAEESYLHLHYLFMDTHESAHTPIWSAGIVTDEKPFVCEWDTATP